MSYLTVSEMTQSTALTQRITAAAAQEGKGDEPTTRGYVEWVSSRIWALTASPGWGAAWESAVASGNPDPGADPAVITDGMILAAVQPMP